MLVLAGVVVVMLVALVQHAPTMIEGTLVALLALVGGWLRSRLAAIPLMALGLATGGRLLQVALFGVARRMVETSFRFRRAACPGTGSHGS